MTSGTPFGGRPATATRDVESVEESDVDQSGCGLFAWFVNVHLLNQNSKATLRYTPFGKLLKINCLIFVGGCAWPITRHLSDSPNAQSCTLDAGGYFPQKAEAPFRRGLR